MTIIMLLPLCFLLALGMGFVLGAQSVRDLIFISPAMVSRILYTIGIVEGCAMGLISALLCCKSSTSSLLTAAVCVVFIPLGGWIASQGFVLGAKAYTYFLGWLDALEKNWTNRT